MTVGFPNIRIYPKQVRFSVPIKFLDNYQPCYNCYYFVITYTIRILYLVVRNLMARSMESFELPQSAFFAVLR